MLENSAIYTGELRHRRHTPLRHDFKQRLFMLYIDLNELADLGRDTRFWLPPGEHAASWFGRLGRVARFRRKDYFGDRGTPIVDCVRELVERETGWRPTGPIRMLAHCSYFGICFNPITIYYCFDGPRVRALIADVHNTPWGRRHQYVLSCEGEDGANRGGAATDQIADFTGQNNEPSVFTFNKTLHVSPFNPMNVTYRWRSNTPGERLLVHMDLSNDDDEEKFFDATLDLRHQPIEPRTLDALLIRFPVMTAQVVGNIYWQALKLWIKGARFHGNPH